MRQGLKSNKKNKKNGAARPKRASIQARSRKRSSNSGSSFRVRYAAAVTALSETTKTEIAAVRATTERILRGG